MLDRRSVGDILKGFGRLTEAEIDRALEHQKQNGGYFGEALVALDLVKRQELDWVLATQFDIPYVAPNPDEVDLAAAGLVTAEWALAHMALPILSTDDVLTVVLAEPNRETGALEQLRFQSGKQLSLALASPDSIRELIRAVFARMASRDEDHGAAIAVTELWELAVRAGLGGCGISARGPTAWGWYHTAEGMAYHLLDRRWEQELQWLLDPAPQDGMHGRELGEWSADLECHGLRSPVGVSFLRSRGGTELFISRRSAHPGDDVPPPEAGVAAAIAAAVSRGDARVRVVCEPATLQSLVLPRIPSFVLAESKRSIHLIDGDAEQPRNVASLRLSTDPERRNSQIEGVRAFEFDVVTAELTGAAREEVAVIAGLAPTVFLAMPGGPEADAGACSWELTVAGNAHRRLDWRLRRLEG